MIVEDRWTASGGRRSGDRRPRILHVATRYLRGGSERRIGDVIRAYPEGNHRVTVGAESELDLARRELAPARVDVLPTLVRVPSPVRDRATLRCLVRLLRECPFDLVVTHQSKGGALGRMAARGAGGPPVIHSLSMASFGPGYPRWQDVLFRSMESRLESATASYAVVGRDLADRYAAIGVPMEKLSVVRSGIRFPVSRSRNDADEVRRRLGIPTARPMILYAGSLERRKNVLDLPSLLTRMPSLPAHPHLVIAGTGPLGDGLQELTRTRGLSGDVSLLGFVADPGPLIAGADVVVLLSKAEGLSQLLVQAAAAGTPFVAFEVDGVRELLDMGAGGAAVPYGDLGAVARAVAGVLAGKRLERPSIDLSSWNPAVIAEGYRRLLRRAMSGRSPILEGAR